MRWIWIFLFVVLSSSASALCEDVDQTKAIVRDVTFCQGTFAIDKAIEVRASDITIACEGTIIEGTYSGTGLAFVGAEDVHVEGCNLRYFQEALFLDADSSVTLDQSVRLSDSVYGVSIVEGATMQGTPTFENIAREQIGIVDERQDIGSIDVTRSQEVSVGEQRVLMFPPDLQVLQGFATALGLRPQKLSSVAVIKQAFVGDGVTRIVIDISGVVDDVYVYEVVESYTVLEGYPIWRDNTMMVKISEDTQLEYVLEGEHESIDEAAPITLVTSEGPRGQVYRRIGFWFGLVLLVVVFFGGVKLYLRA